MADDARGMIVERALEHMPRHVWDPRPVARLIAQARRYVLTDEASYRLGEIINACGPALIANRQFAIPPYPVTYIELSIKMVNEGIGRSAGRPVAGAEDNLLGVLITGDQIRVFVDWGDDRMAAAAPFIYTRGGPDLMPVPHVDTRRRWSGGMDWLHAALRLGTTLHDMRDPLVLNQEWGVSSAYRTPRPTSILPLEVVQACFGELRTILAALLVLNQPLAIKLDHIPARRGGARRRNRPYAAHSLVSINLGERREYVAHFGQHHPNRQSPRRHEVSGHFVHHHCRRGCEHAWPAQPMVTESGAPYWLCSRCGGRRTWRAAHLRGDATVGFVTKSYRVDHVPQ